EVDPVFGEEPTVLLQTQRCLLVKPILATRLRLSQRRSMPRVAHLAETDHPVVVLVPEREAKTTKAAAECQAIDAAQLGVVAQHLRQAIARDPAAQVVDMVHPDIGREPSQDWRQLEIGAAVQSTLVEAPSGAALPDGVLELMLDVKQPDA